jgi:hypothetical protein
LIDEPWPFLMTPAQHRQWAANARKLDRPDLARHHEQLARAIEKIATGIGPQKALVDDAHVVSFSFTQPPSIKAADSSRPAVCRA